jgi:hypothetical protein
MLSIHLFEPSLSPVVRLCKPLGFNLNWAILGLAVDMQQFRDLAADGPKIRV